MKETQGRSWVIAVVLALAIRFPCSMRVYIYQMVILTEFSIYVSVYRVYY